MIVDKNLENLFSTIVCKVCSATVTKLYSIF